MTIKKTPFFTIFTFILVLIFVACGSKSDASKTEETTQPAQQTSAQPESTKAVLADVQVISLEDQFIFTIPKDWKGDENTQVWCPATENLDIPLPPVSLHCGGIPMMPDTTIDNLIKSHIGTEPLQKKHVTVCNYKGFVCQWESYSHKHIGLFLEEKVGGGMSIINFFRCQAPTASFNTYAETFKRIIDSVKCK